ncbi:MAG: glycosyltransferase family 39 protein [Candidatus Omnitrophica bacterium]|nr:glycosyltransferase family 39 protein [Candidatus Omnitrophota bacterium]
MNQVVYLFGNPVKFCGIYWPNGLNATASVFYYLFGKSLFSAKLSLMPYLFILLLSTYLIGRKLFSDFVGLLAMFLLYMYPLIFESFRQFQLDSPLTAMVALSILFLIKCNDFKSRKYSLWLGISLGWGMLIKGQAILYIIGPLCFVLYRACRHCWVHPLRSRQLQNIGIFMLLSVMIASLWWGHQIGATVSELMRHTVNPDRRMQFSWSWYEKYSFESLSYYMRELLTPLGLPFYIIFLISFLFFLKLKVKHKGIALCWSVFPFLLFSVLIKIKDVRFLMPVFPFMAIITAWGVNEVKNKAIQCFTLFFIIAFCIIQYHTLSYWPLHKRNVSKIFFLKMFGTTLYDTFGVRTIDFKIDEVINVIRRNTSAKQYIVMGVITACDERPAPWEVVYWLKMKDELLEPIHLTEMHHSFLLNYDSIDFILLCVPLNNSLQLNSSLQWPAGEELRMFLKTKYSDKIGELEVAFPITWNKVLKLLENDRINFQLVGKIAIEDSKYFVYKRIM